MLLLLQLVLAHLINRLVLRPWWYRPNRDERESFGLNASLYLLCAAACVNFGLGQRTAVAIVLLSVIHSVLDWAERRLFRDDWRAFVLILAAQVAAIALVGTPTLDRGP